MDDWGRFWIRRAICTEMDLMETKMGAAVYTGMDRGLDENIWEN
jgi:hypothetical protein